MGVPLVGCASHQLKLAIKKYLAPYETLLDEVNALMLELRHDNNFAELKKHTDLQPVKRTVTRWSSTFTLLERYIHIRSEIKKVEAAEELVPTGGKHRKLVAVFEHLKIFESICKRLQRKGTDVAEVRLMFDGLVAEYPVMADHLKASAKIVHTPVFESGVVKVNAGTALVDGNNSSRALRGAGTSWKEAQGERGRLRVVVAPRKEIVGDCWRHQLRTQFVHCNQLCNVFAL
ncbi:unnamed protein product [Phytophthora fragariaefolia]|uniref:Unnamed protein product n=1 Tax=Phytophthora fragariaefolia TaxID=1490495 RepID=A0A9W6YD66_9STRA|nr:unnamed protein product [Phytophthora fragariaefolia]